MRRSALVMLIGLSAKNAILIVEFAKDAYDKGNTLVEAALGRPVCASAHHYERPSPYPRLRSFGGLQPVQAESPRQILGTAVIGGMLASTSSPSSSYRLLLRRGKHLGTAFGKGREPPTFQRPPMKEATHEASRN